MVKNKKELYYTKDLDIYYNTLKSKFKSNVIISQEKKVLLDDFQTFVYTYFKHHTTDINGNQTPLSKYHISLFNELFSDKVKILAEFPRGFAKSTVFGLFAPIYFMLRGDAHMIMLISSSKELSTQLLIHIQNEFEENDNLIKDFGPFISDGTWKKGNFYVEKYDCMFKCASKGQSVRGTKNKNHRIDFCIIDDIDDDESCRNKEIVKYQFDWLMQNVMGAVGLNKHKVLFLGNRFSHNMILDHFSKIPKIKHIKINALDENGESIWKEMYSTDTLLDKREEIGSIRFQREYMNTPITEGSVFKEEWLQFKPMVNYESYQYIITYLDPSWKKNADYKAIITLGFINKEYHIIDIYLKKQTMNDVINYLYQLNDKFLQCAYSMYYEANFSQDLHQKEFDEISSEKGFRLPIIQDKDKKENKEARIESMSSVFENGMMYINTLISYSTDFAEFKNQLISFPDTKNDDGIDALQSAYVKLNLRVRSIYFERFSGNNERIYENIY